MNKSYNEQSYFENVQEKNNDQFRDLQNRTGVYIFLNNNITIVNSKKYSKMLNELLSQLKCQKDIFIVEINDFFIEFQVYNSKISKISIPKNPNYLRSISVKVSDTRNKNYISQAVIKEIYQVQECVLIIQTNFAGHFDLEQEGLIDIQPGLQTNNLARRLNSYVLSQDQDSNPTIQIDEIIDLIAILKIIKENNSNHQLLGILNVLAIVQENSQNNLNISDNIMRQYKSKLNKYEIVLREIEIYFKKDNNNDETNQYLSTLNYYINYIKNSNFNLIKTKSNYTVLNNTQNQIDISQFKINSSESLKKQIENIYITRINQQSENEQSIRSILFMFENSSDFTLIAQQIKQFQESIDFKNQESPNLDESIVSNNQRKYSYLYLLSKYDLMKKFIAMFQSSCVVAKNSINKIPELYIILYQSSEFLKEYLNLVHSKEQCIPGSNEDVLIQNNQNLNQSHTINLDPNSISIQINEVPQPLSPESNLGTFRINDNQNIEQQEYYSFDKTGIHGRSVDHYPEEQEGIQTEMSQTKRSNELMDTVRVMTNNIDSQQKANYQNQLFNDAYKFNSGNKTNDQIRRQELDLLISKMPTDMINQLINVVSSLCSYLQSCKNSHSNDTINAGIYISMRYVKLIEQYQEIMKRNEMQLEQVSLCKQFEKLMNKIQKNIQNQEFSMKGKMNNDISYDKNDNTFQTMQEELMKFEMIKECIKLIDQCHLRSKIKDEEQTDWNTKIDSI